MPAGRPAPRPPPPIRRAQTGAHARPHPPRSAVADRSALPPEAPADPRRPSQLPARRQSAPAASSPPGTGAPAARGWLPEPSGWRHPAPGPPHGPGKGWRGSPTGSAARLPRRPSTAPAPGARRRSCVPAGARCWRAGPDRVRESWRKSPAAPRSAPPAPARWRLPHGAAPSPSS